MREAEERLERLEVPRDLRGVGRGRGRGVVG